MILTNLSRAVTSYKLICPKDIHREIDKGRSGLGRYISVIFGVINFFPLPICMDEGSGGVAAAARMPVRDISF